MAPRSTDDKPAEKPTADSKSAPEKSAPEKQSSGTAYLNTTSGPVVYDKAGHTVDAAGWTPEIHLDDIGRSARRAGHLLPHSAL